MHKERDHMNMFHNNAACLISETCDSILSSSIFLDHAFFFNHLGINSVVSDEEKKKKIVYPRLF